MLRYILRLAAESELFATSPMDAFVEAIAQLDRDFLAIAPSLKKSYCGSTVLTVYIRDGIIYTCTVGDSRCMLCRSA